MHIAAKEGRDRVSSGRVAVRCGGIARFPTRTEGLPSSRHARALPARCFGREWV